MVTPYYSDEAVALFAGDCLEVLREMPDASVDAVLTDPPYNVGKDYGGHFDSMPPSEYHGWLKERLTEAGRVSRDALVWFPGTRNIGSIGESVPEGFRVHRMLGWHRKEFAGDKWNGGPAMSWEPIVWASRAEKPAFNRLFGAWGRDFLVVPSTHGDPWAREHPCPKPEIVMRWLIGLFVPEGGSVLDPFAGSGATLRAAKDLGRTALGIELNPIFCDLSVRRLSQEVLDLSSSSSDRGVR